MLGLTALRRARHSGRCGAVGAPLSRFTHGEPRRTNTKSRPLSDKGDAGNRSAARFCLPPACSGRCDPLAHRPPDETLALHWRCGVIRMPFRLLDPTARDPSEVVLQADHHRQVADALESLRGVEWGDAVRLHGRMAADEVPCRLVGEDSPNWAQRPVTPTEVCSVSA